MKFKGILKGDSTYRHFEFDDDNVEVKNGVTYYKVNYGKNPLEGEFAEDEISYIPVDKVMVLGIKKPKQFQKTEPVPEPKQEIEEEKPKAKKTRTKKQISDTIFGDVNSNLTGLTPYEYYLEEIHSDRGVQGIQNKLNELGEEGWEMCGFNINKSFFSDITIIAIFKRKRG